jgi:hypothetical protein
MGKVPRDETAYVNKNTPGGPGIAFRRSLYYRDHSKGKAPLLRGLTVSILTFSHAIQRPMFPESLARMILYP